MSFGCSFFASFKELFQRRWLDTDLAICRKEHFDVLPMRRGTKIDLASSITSPRRVPVVSIYILNITAVEDSLCSQQGVDAPSGALGLFEHRMLL